ncbi:hypothetical protein ACFOOL_07500 [Devosia honganensis]|uniref:FAD dependent oxidoreductase domain-containing protein n=1 Tax=Devosia honganensis TaxID=1610527 RepID=A0ABV7X1Z9_9HYPH
MNGGVFDFAVIGSSPLARLLAGLLAGVHGRRVAFVGESQAGYRLPRSIDLSVAPITRPESWFMLTEGVAETLTLVGRIARRGAWSRQDPIFFADGAAPIEALSHMRHMALGHGMAAEPAAPSLLGPGRAGVVLRDAVRLNRPVLEPALDLWLARQGVERVAPGRIEIAPDGAAALSVDGGGIEARQAILADHDAIISFLPLPQWPRLLRRQSFASILTTPTPPLAAPIMLEINSGTILLQQPEGGIAAIGPGDLAAFSGHLHGLLGRERQVEQAGQTGFAVLATADGAPALGRAAGTGADIVAGMGGFGAFLAPALARWLAGAARAHEAEWFDARLVNRAAAGPPVADFVPPRQAGAP